MSDRIIAVVGATGAQGGGLVKATLADKDKSFRVRAVVRDPNSEKAKALAAKGAEVVAGDVDDVESLTKAFKGAHGVFGVTFYWAHGSPERENKQASNIAHAAKAAGVSHVVWSTLEDTRKFVPPGDDSMPTLMGKYKVPHFDAKGEMDHVFTDLGVPTTFLYASFYWDNFIHFGMGPTKGPDGVLGITMAIGDAKMAGVAAEDIGAVALGLFKQGKTAIGQRVGVAGEHLTGPEMAAAMSRAIGQPVRFNSVPPEVFRGFGFPGAEDVGNMFQFYRDFEKVCNDMRDVKRSRSLAPGLQSFDQWLAANASRIPIG
jgi:uncharacterized protein YbjT (DUF2867 family)